MATLIGVSEDRTAFFIRYPSEPILAELALSEIGRMSKKRWIAVMDDLHKLFLQGYGAGARGELVGLILLLVAKYCVITSEKGLYFYVSDEVPLTLYLEHLFGVESAKNIRPIKKKSGSGRDDKQDKTYDQFLLSSFMSATHFIECSGIASPFTRDPDEVLEELYLCRTGLVMPENWKGADVLIPVRTVGSSRSASEYSAILVDFKSSDGDASDADSATRKRSSEYVFEEQENFHDGWKDVQCIRMYMLLQQYRLHRVHTVILCG